MKHIKPYKIFESTDINRDVNDISLELLDKGLNVDISWDPWINDNLDCDIIIWKHNGDERHIPFEFDQDCVDFALRINDYMISNGIYLINSTIVQSGSEPNRRSSDMDKTVKILSSLSTVEEIYFNFTNHLQKFG